MRYNKATSSLPLMMSLINSSIVCKPITESSFAAIILDFVKLFLDFILSKSKSKSRTQKTYKSLRRIVVIFVVSLESKVVKLHKEYQLVGIVV